MCNIAEGYIVYFSKASLANPAVLARIADWRCPLSVQQHDTIYADMEAPVL